MADETTRTCTKCERELPLSAFAKDSRRSSGLRAGCRRCDADERADRRRGDKPRPGGLVLVPRFPEPPRAVEPPAPPAAPAPARGTSTTTYAAAAEAFIDALVPPAGAADALLVRSLRGLAELLDVAELGTGDWVVRDTTSLVSKLVAVQRELAATRAAKASAQPAAPPKAGLLASGQF